MSVAINTKSKVNSAATSMKKVFNLAKKAVSYASKVNAKRSSNASHVMTIADRWTTTYNSLPPDLQKLSTHLLQNGISEFKRRNPHIQKWADLQLVQAQTAVMTTVKIDSSMQRQLDIFWIAHLLSRFSVTKVMPIQVYKDASGQVLAWDGQHTLYLLWLIATEVFDEDPENVIIPVNIYSSNLKSEMRENFIDLNSSVGKKHIDTIDLMIQQILGVRIDGNKNPDWLLTERKQVLAEENDLFFTASKFGDAHMEGAIGRLVEVTKHDNLNTVSWLFKYLSMTTSQYQRSADEKELVMLSKFFDLCRIDGISVDDAYIAEVYTVTNKWKTDFTPDGPFWEKAATAYYNWHNSMHFGTHARFDKNPSLGMPFLIAQLKKDMKNPVPSFNSNSGFVPATADLF